MMGTSIKAKFVQAAKWLIATGLLVYLGSNLASQWQAVRQYNWDIGVVPLAVATAIAFGTFMFIVWIWYQLLHNAGGYISYWTTYRIWFVSALLRYLPGKIAGVISMVYLCEKEGVSKTVCLSSGALNQGFSLLSGLSIGLFFLFVNQSGALSHETVLWSVGILVAGFITAPYFIERVINPWLNRMGWPAVKYNIGLREFVFYFSLYLLVWGSFGLGFFFVVRSLVGVPFSLVPEMAAIFTISYLAGFLAIFTPNGLGVRESLLTVLLSAYMPMPVAIITAAVARVWLTVAELLCIGLAYGSPKSTRTRC